MALSAAVWMREKEDFSQVFSVTASMQWAFVVNLVD